MPLLDYSGSENEQSPPRYQVFSAMAVLNTWYLGGLCSRGLIPHSNTLQILHDEMFTDIPFSHAASR